MRKLFVRALVVAASAATALLVTTAAAAATTQPKEHDPVFDNGTGSVGVLVTKLSHADATSRLRSSGITWSSSGGLHGPHKPPPPPLPKGKPTPHPRHPN